MYLDVQVTFSCFEWCWLDGFPGDLATIICLIGGDHLDILPSSLDLIKIISRSVRLRVGPLELPVLEEVDALGVA